MVVKENPDRKKNKCCTSSEKVINFKKKKNYMIFSQMLGTVYKKTGEGYIEWQRVTTIGTTSGTTDDNE